MEHDQRTQPRHKKRRQEVREGWLLRGCVWGVVVALHIAGAVLMLALPATRSAIPDHTDATALQVRFVELPATQPLPPHSLVEIARLSQPRRHTPAPERTPHVVENKSAVPK